MYHPIQWDMVRAKVRGESWAQAILEQVRIEFDFWQQALRLNGPEHESAWTHHYFCDADGAALRFDVNNAKAHTCPQCGQTYEGQPWEGAWYTKMHGAAMGQLERAAVLMHFHDLDGGSVAEAARVQLDQIIRFYAKHYPEYAVHGQRAGVGRVQPQSLDESVWAIAFFHGLRVAGISRHSEHLHADAALLEQLDAMARLIIELLLPQMQPKRVHNIYCWILGAIAACAVWLEDADLIELCRDGEYGINQQILEGFHEDGLWFEINPGYHYYTVDGLLSYLEATGPSGISKAAAQSLARAINHPPQLAYADGRLPAYADGWPDRFTYHYAHLAEAAYSLLPEEEIDLTAYYQQAPPLPLKMVEGAIDLPEVSSLLAQRGSIRALLFGPRSLDPNASVPVAPSPLVWKDAGLVLLQNEAVRIAMRFGPYSGHHDHLDRLCVDVEASNGWQSLDLGTSGYGAKFTEWMRSPLAHNLIVVNGTMQPKHQGELVFVASDRVEAWSAFSGVSMSRSLQLNAHGWLDDYRLTQTEARPCYWAFHGDGEFHLKLTQVESASLDDLPYGEWLQNVRKVNRESLMQGGLFIGTWTDGQSVGMHMQVTIPAGFDVYLADAPGNPNGRKMSLVLIRGVCQQANFTAEFRLPNKC